jgi:broad specificity phosphatase PhoE
VNKKIAQISIALLALSFTAHIFAEQPQTEKSSICPSLKDATILIIRHAEKPDNGDELSPAGVQRADSYAQYFQDFRVDARSLKLDHLFATADSKSSRRSRLTLEPLARTLGLNVDCRFKNKNARELADEIQSHDHGKAILICWHHGQIPEVVRDLGADPARLLPGGKWPDNQFAWVLELRYDHQGRLIPAETRRVNESLMPGDPK